MTTAEQTTRAFDWSDEDWPALTLHGALDRATARWGADKIAYRYVDEGVDLTLGALRDAADAWTAALLGAGVRRGDRVAIALAGDALWPVLQLACSQAGAVVVGINTRYGSRELAHVLASARPALAITTGDRDGRTFATLLEGVLDAEAARTGVERPPVVVVDGDASRRCTPVAAFLVGGAEHRAAVAARRAQAAPADVALIQYTSGSTAAPKGVELSHDALLRSAFHVMCAAGYDEHDVVYSALPFYHVGGSITTGPAALVCGAQMVVPEFYDAVRSVGHLLDHRCTAVQGHAAMFTMQIDAASAGGVLDDLRRGLAKGWAAAPPTVMRRIATELGIGGIVPVYGMSEYGLITAGSRGEPLDQRLAGVGRPVPGTAVRLDGADAPGAVGEILVRGAQRMLCYHGDEAATRAALTDDGWLRTGDLGRWDAEGRLQFAGREKEMIKPGGENVSAAEIEEFLRDHPHIVGVAVVRVRDARLGEAPAAVVQVVPGEHVDLDAVRAYCAGRIASFKTPKAVFVEAELPMLANGKIDKLTLAQRYGDHLVAGR
jgi:fatty-acyl-CoA synthase